MSAFKQKMAKLGVRAGLLAGASAAVLAISGIGASSALAAPACPNKTFNLQGKGASLQRVAQEQWTGREVPSGEPLKEIPHKKLEPEIGYAKACKEGPTMSYTSTGSGPGLESFRFTGAGAIDTSLAFVGSDDAPTAAQIKNAQEAGEAGLHAIIVPVIQTSIAVPIHLPAGCVINGGITWKDLNKLFAGTITEWSGLATDNGNEACNAKITRVVRKEGSGTTYQFKNYLSVLENTLGGVGPGCEAELGKKNWAELREIGAEGKPNITWPECAGTSPVERKAGGGAVAEFVANTVNTIGYAALPDAKAKGAAVAALQNEEPEGVPTYANPYKALGEEANCGSRVYTVPEGGRKGQAAESIDWSAVFGAKPQVGSAYPLCTLTYDIGWNTYKLAKYAEPEKIAENVKDYILNYVLGKEEGQKVGHWYAPLPETEKAENNVLGAAITAAEKLK